MAKEVVYVSTHSTVFVPKVGQFGPTIEKTKTKKLQKMTLIGNIIEVEMLNERNQTVIISLPLSSVNHFVLAETKKDEKDS